MGHGRMFREQFWRIYYPFYFFLSDGKASEGLSKWVIGLSEEVWGQTLAFMEGGRLSETVTRRRDDEFGLACQIFFLFWEVA